MIACDLAVAVEGALFGTPESRIGLFPMMIMPYMLRVLPARKFMELCMTGESIDAPEALRIGVLNEVVPVADFDARIAAWSDLLASRSPTAIRLGKQGFHAMRDMGMQQALEFAQLMLPMMAATEDAREGIQGFTEHMARMVGELLEFRQLVPLGEMVDQIHGDPGNSLGLVADSLQVGDGLDHGNDQTKIAGRRLSKRQNLGALLIDRDFQGIHLVVVSNHFLSQVRIAVQQGIHRGLDLRLNQPTQREELGHDGSQPHQRIIGS